MWDFETAYVRPSGASPWVLGIAFGCLCIVGMQMFLLHQQSAALSAMTALQLALAAQSGCVHMLHWPCPARCALA